MQSIQPFVLVFTIFAIIRLRRSPESAMIDVCLPALLLVPSFCILRIPHIPYISCVDAALIPIAFVTLVRRWSSWRFQRADLWVLLFVVAGGYTDYLNLGLRTAIFRFPGSFLDLLLAYITGKLLIEQTGSRERFAQRIASLLAVVGFVSIVEFIGKKNLFIIVARRLFMSDFSEYDQMRNGFLRVKGPFEGPEEAGIMLLVGFFLSLWLWFIHKSRKDAPEPRYLGLRRSIVCMGGILLGLFMTLSRGPWIGAVAGFLIAQIGLVKNKRIAIVAALVLGTVGGVLAHNKAEEYSNRAKEYSQADWGGLSETQTSALYRTHLYDTYRPTAERAGCLD